MDGAFGLRKRVRCAADEEVYAMQVGAPRLTGLPATSAAGLSQYLLWCTQICPHSFAGGNPQRLALVCSDLAVRLYDSAELFYCGEE